MDKEVFLAKATAGMHFRVSADFIESVVDETGEKHEWEEYIIEYQEELPESYGYSYL